MKDNVFHDCHRFGSYPDNQHPRQLERDEDGYVVKNETTGRLESCYEFKADGTGGKFWKNNFESFLIDIEKIPD